MGTTMDRGRREKLEAAGWRVGDTAEFLGLSDAESRLIDLRLAVGRAVRRGREARGLTQKQLAALAGTTQPRVAKIEAAAAEVSLDLMLRAFFAVGGIAALELKMEDPAPTAEAQPRAAPGKRPRKAVGSSS